MFRCAFVWFEDDSTCYHFQHPFDIGDGLEIDGVAYTVKEIRLLSTLLIDGRGSDVQCANTVLNTKYIMNRRRSGPMTETFEFTVGYSTTFEQLEDLRREFHLLHFWRLEDLTFPDSLLIQTGCSNSSEQRVGITFQCLTFRFRSYRTSRA